MTILAAAGAAAAVAATAAPAAADKAGKAAAGQAAQATQGSLTGVSGTSARDVWTVGSGPGGTLIEHWNGARWSVVPSPSPGTGAGKTSELSGVAAVSPTDAWAVGSYSSGPHEGDTTTFGLIEHWNGKRWSKVACPCGSNNSGGPVLAGISAVSRSDIWAVGSGGSGPLIVHWNGRTWAAAPLSGNKGAEFTAVSATSARSGWAVGVARGAGPALTAHWNGRKWSWVSAPGSATFNDLRAVAARSPSSAWAGGQSGGAVEALRWNGRKWSAVPGPKVTGRSPTFDAIAAVPGGSPWAVGFRAVKSGARTFELNLIARWSGTRWVTVSSPDVRLSDDLLSGVWRTSARNVWAVGSSAEEQNKAEILHWNGRSWHLVTP
ncbi:MAG TPA: hypothetical protein VHU92_20840 [Streptosporangiaceae bacterium]|jgi:hypothetical protein|nr:hypothetical protein [Streptosporangiaceae bacterium]